MFLSKVWYSVLLQDCHDPKTIGVFAFRAKREREEDNRPIAGTGTFLYVLQDNRTNFGEVHVFSRNRDIRRTVCRKIVCGLNFSVNREGD